MLMELRSQNFRSVGHDGGARVFARFPRGNVRTHRSWGDHDDPRMRSRQAPGSGFPHGDELQFMD